MTSHRTGASTVTTEPAFRRLFRGSTILFAVSVLLLLYFVALPIVGMIWESLRTPEGYSLDNYSRFFTTGDLLRATLNTVLVALVTGLGSVLSPRRLLSAWRGRACGESGCLVSPSSYALPARRS